MVSGARLLLNVLMNPGMSRSDLDLIVANLRADLGEGERAMLVQTLIETFPPDIAETVAQVSFKEAGYPPPDLLSDPRSTAELWAAEANVAELRAYAMVSFMSMSPKMRAGFVNWASGKIDGDVNGS